MDKHNILDESKFIVVTGANRGIGLEIVRYLASKSHRVLGLSRNTNHLAELATEFNGLIQFESVDLADEAIDLEKVVSSHTKRVDALINNAGALLNKPFVDTTIVDWKSLIAINLLASVRMVHACLPIMPKDAQILNISSMGGFQGSMKFPGLSAYSTTKGALSILTECLSEELIGYGINVNAFCLGAVQTEMLNEAFPGYTAPVSSQEMAAFIGDFVTKHGKLFNGKIIPVSINNPSS